MEVIELETINKQNMTRLHNSWFFGKTVVLPQNWRHWHKIKEIQFYFVIIFSWCRMSVDLGVFQDKWADKTRPCISGMEHFFTVVIAVLAPYLCPTVSRASPVIGACPISPPGKLQSSVSSFGTTFRASSARGHMSRLYVSRALDETTHLVTFPTSANHLVFWNLID